MKFKELKKSLAGGVAPIYLVTGEDSFFIERSVKLITDVCLSEPSLNLANFEGQDLKGNVGDLLDALSVYPFMSEKRVVVVREYYPLSQDAAKLKGYFENPSDTTVLIICNSGKSDNLSKLPSVTVVDCAKGDDGLLSAWIYGEGKKNGTVFEPEAVKKIIEYCRSDMTRINGEVMKLISYVADDKVVTSEDVEALCVKETEYELYEVVDFIASRKREKAYYALVGMMDGAGDGQRLFVSLYYHFRRLLYVSVSNMTDEELSKVLKVKEYAIKRSRVQAKSFSAKRLKAITDDLSRYDSAFKQGLIEPTSAMWNGILNVLIG